jgi:hypothetical protein
MPSEDSDIKVGVVYLKEAKLRSGCRVKHSLCRVCFCPAESRERGYAGKPSTKLAAFNQEPLLL